MNREEAVERCKQDLLVRELLKLEDKDIADNSGNGGGRKEAGRKGSENAKH